MSGSAADREERARAVAAHFDIAGRLVEVARLGSGLIHDTFELRMQEGAEPRRYVAQRINDEVFRAPGDVLHNIALVTEHLRRQLEAEGADDRARRCLRLVPSREGTPCWIDDEGATWRVYPFVEGSLALDQAPSPAQAREAARAFGDFVRRLADLDPARLRETIPGFHDLDGRLAQLGRAAEHNARGRRAEAEHALAVALHDVLRRSLDALGPLPRRVVHNDCKLNNVLLDAHSGEALCVVDLDTVMEGDLVADFGDLVRTAATPAAEDEHDLSRVVFDLERFDALARGYLEGLGGALTPAERDALPLAGPVLALELGSRFLADHFDGDVYFRATREDHNLTRARCQLRLCERMLEALPEARARIEAAASESRTSG